MTMATRRDELRSAPFPRSMAEDPRRNPLSRVALHRWGDVRVDLARHEGARVVEPVADDLDVDALVQRQRRPGVAQAVERQPRQQLIGVGPVVLLLLAD